MSMHKVSFECHIAKVVALRLFLKTKCLSETNMEKGCLFFNFNVFQNLDLFFKWDVVLMKLILI